MCFIPDDMGLRMRILQVYLIIVTRRAQKGELLISRDRVLAYTAHNWRLIESRLLVGATDPIELQGAMPRGS
jgi:hypothetical protein